MCFAKHTFVKMKKVYTDLYKIQISITPKISKRYVRRYIRYRTLKVFAAVCYQCFERYWMCCSFHAWKRKPWSFGFSQREGNPWIHRSFTLLNTVYSSGSQTVGKLPLGVLCDFQGVSQTKTTLFCIMSAHCKTHFRTEMRKLFIEGNET